MTITIRTLTRRASGRESIRAVETPKSQLSIGRATDCDINLPDLLVSLHHARLTVSQGTFLIEAEGGNEFKFNGRLVNRAEARFGDNAAAQFGPYRLTFVAPGGQLSIDVERIEQAKTEIADPEKVFSLRHTWLAKRTPSWILVALVAAVFMIFPIITYATAPTRSPISSGVVSPQRVEAGQLWLSGGLAGPHQRLARDCAACHVKPFESVRDQSCLQCHDDIQHHADSQRMRTSEQSSNPAQAGLRMIAATFNKPAGRCAECHMEHNGLNGVEPRTQASCTKCHDGLSTRLKDAKVGDASDFGRDHPDFFPTIVKTPDLEKPVFHKVSLTVLDAARKERERLAQETPQASCAGFAVGQPNFRGLVHPGGADAMPEAARAGDNSGLIFPHSIHLAEKGCVSALAQQIGAKAGYDKKLECHDCHTRDDQNSGYKPVVMEEACSACHSLVFDNGGGAVRSLRHGDTNDVIATLIDFYQSRIVGAAVRPVALGEERRRPGQAAVQQVSTSREAAFSQAGGRARERVQAIFSEGGACYGCHVIKPPSSPSGIDFKIAPVTLRDAFLPAGIFDHGAHEPGELTCDDCHNATTSRTSADVLVPHVQTCQKCHGGEHATAKVESSCIMCHGFHSNDPAAPVMTPVTVGRSHQAAVGAARGALK